MNEFELIRTFFARQPVSRTDVAAGIGDDAALLRVPSDQQLVVTTDLMVAGIHFYPDVDPASLGHKSLAINLSDLASMGAEPAWFLLNLSMLTAEPKWLESFCEGLFNLARIYNMQLVGGDTSRGPLTIGIEGHGFVPENIALRRSGAQAGDKIYVTGTLGEAALARHHHESEIRLHNEELAVVKKRLEWPTPRVKEGLALRGISCCAIDISDGLLADLGHILETSGVGARVHLDKIPISTISRAHLDETGWEVILAGGDDYELCFTVPADKTMDFEKQPFDCGCQCIGVIETEPGLRIVDKSGKPYHTNETGHDHFAKNKKSTESLH